MNIRSGIPITRHAAGFTLVELLIVLAIAATLAALATPSYKRLMSSQRIRGASMDMISNLTFARSEAIKRNGNVELASASGNASWESGWTVKPSGGAAGTEVRVQDAYRNLAITAAGVPDPSRVAYNRNGRINALAPVRFQISDPAYGINNDSRCVTVTVTGMPVSKKGSC